MVTMNVIRLSLKSLLLTVTAAACLLGIYRGGSIAGFGALLALTSLAVIAQTAVAVRSLPRIRPFRMCFALVGWVGLIATLTSRVPISDVNIIRSMWWHLDDPDASSFSFYGSAFLGINYLCATLLWASVCGLAAMALAGLLRGSKVHRKRGEDRRDRAS